MASEQQIQNKIKTYIENKGGYVIKVVSATKAGVPDIIACYKGYFLGIEVKRPSTKSNVSKLQLFNIKKIKEARGWAIVAWEVKQVEDLLEVINEIC